MWDIGYDGQLETTDLMLSEKPKRLLWRRIFFVHFKGKVEKTLYTERIKLTFTLEPRLDIYKYFEISSTTLHKVQG